MTYNANDIYVPEYPHRGSESLKRWVTSQMQIGQTVNVYTGGPVERNAPEEGFSWRSATSAVKSVAKSGLIRAEEHRWDVTAYKVTRLR